jgi:hypothetical protein
MSMNSEWMWIAFAAVAVLAIVGLIAVGLRRARSEKLREHFGREYEHTVEAAGSRAAAEQELVARAKEAKSFDIHPLTASGRDRYRLDWQKIEARFVERPKTAVVEADELIGAVMRDRGYPVADFDKHVDIVSVKHPRVVEHYRAGHAILDAGGSTEDLRQAMLHYRSLFEELVGAASGADVEQPIPAQSEIDDAVNRVAVLREQKEERAAR